MSLKTARKTMLTLLGAMALSLLSSAVLTGAHHLPAALLSLVLGIVLFFVFMHYSFSHWRCPHCDEFLGWGLGKGIPFCPYCHERLDK